MADSIVEAAKDGLTREVQWFLSQGEDVNVTDGNGRTALHWALQKGTPLPFAHCVITLLRAGADLDLKDNDGNPPLHIAVRHNQPQLVKLLVKAGADLRLVDARALNCYNLARGILGTQNEVTRFLAEIMEKIMPGSTDLGKTAAKEEGAQQKHAGMNGDAEPASPATASQRSASASGRSAATNPAQRAQPTPVASFHSHFVVVTYAGISLAVVELSEDLSESLASLRAKMEEDEVPLRFAYSFTFQGTGALVTRKQEARFLVAQCAAPWTPSTPTGTTPSPIAVGGKETVVYQVEIVKQDNNKPMRGHQYLSAADLDM